MIGPRAERTAVVALFMLLNYILDIMFLPIELSCSQPWSEKRFAEGGGGEAKHS